MTLKAESVSLLLYLIAIWISSLEICCRNIRSAANTAQVYDVYDAVKSVYGMSRIETSGEGSGLSRRDGTRKEMAQVLAFPDCLNPRKGKDFTLPVKDINFVLLLSEANFDRLGMNLGVRPELRRCAGQRRHHVEKGTVYDDLTTIPRVA